MCQNNYPFSAQISVQEPARASVLFLRHTTVTIISQQKQLINRAYRKSYALRRSMYGRFRFLRRTQYTAGAERDSGCDVTCNLHSCIPCAVRATGLLSQEKFKALYSKGKVFYSYITIALTSARHSPLLSTFDSSSS